MDGFYEEDDRIVGHAADPYHRVDIRNTSRHLVVRDGDRVVADTHRPVVLYESGFAPRWYVPREDIDETQLEHVEGQTFCPYKGLADYYTVGDHKKAAWSYLDAWQESAASRAIWCPSSPTRSRSGSTIGACISNPDRPSSPTVSTAASTPMRFCEAAHGAHRESHTGSRDPARVRPGQVPGFLPRQTRVHPRRRLRTLTDFRVVQLTPPGSSTSIQFGDGLTDARPGSVQGLYLVVDDIAAVRDELVDHGVGVTSIRHKDVDSGQWRGRFRLGVDPEVRLRQLRRLQRSRRQHLGASGAWQPTWITVRRFWCST